MSASWNKRIYNLPALPVELWQNIIEIATYIPGVLEPEVWKLADRPSADVIRDQQKELRAALVTKRYLVRVSKHWFAMAAPYLYETIIISHQRTLLPLCDSFQQRLKAGGQMSHDESRHLGWYTKRLDFAARDLGDLYPDRLAEAIRYLPNLSIFNLTPRRENANGAAFSCVARALAETCGPRLRLLNFSIRVMEHEWQLLLSSAPNLLALHRPDVLAETSPIHASAPYLAKLRSLTTPSTVRHYGQTNLPLDLVHRSLYPNLRHVEVSSIFPYNGPCEGDNQIRVLRVYVPGVAWYWRNIKQYFANIHRLVLFLERWEDFPGTFTVPLSVTHLSLSCRRMQGRARTFEWLFGVLATMCRKNANLRSVSLVSGRIRQYLRSHHPKTLALGMESIKECPFVLEDDEGRPFA